MVKHCKKRLSKSAQPVGGRAGAQGGLDPPLMPFLAHLSHHLISFRCFPTLQVEMRALSIGEGEQGELRDADLTGITRTPGWAAPSLAQAPRGTKAELLCGVSREDRKWML